MQVRGQMYNYYRYIESTGFFEEVRLLSKNTDIVFAGLSAGAAVSQFAALDYKRIRGVYLYACRRSETTRSKGTTRPSAVPSRPPGGTSSTLGLSCLPTTPLHPPCSLSYPIRQSSPPCACLICVSGGGSTPPLMLATA